MAGGNALVVQGFESEFLVRPGFAGEYPQGDYDSKDRVDRAFPHL